jgi:hypothetical protein
MLILLKSSFELYDYINFIERKDENLEYEIILESFTYTYDVIELYDNLKHINIKDIINKCFNVYKIITKDDMSLLTLHIDTLFVRFGDKIYKQIIGIPMGSSVSPILSMITILDKCIENGFKSMLLYIDDFKLLFNSKENVERFRRILNKELDLDIVVNKNDGSMLELSMDDNYIFYYDINNQRKHKMNSKINIPNFRCSFENIGNNININTIKGYINKIHKMSYLPKYFYNNNINLMIRCFNSGHILNYVMSRNNRLLNTKQHNTQLITKDLTLRLKDINQDLIQKEELRNTIKVRVREKECLTDKDKTQRYRIGEVLCRLCRILRDF